MKFDPFGRVAYVYAAIILALGFLIFRAVIDSNFGRSLVGIRDMSIIETPPKDRLSIQTNVVKFDAPVLERAILDHAARAALVFFV